MSGSNGDEQGPARIALEQVVVDGVEGLGGN